MNITVRGTGNNAFVKASDVERYLFSLSRNVTDPMARIALETAAEAFTEIMEVD